MFLQSGWKKMIWVASISLAVAACGGGGGDGGNPGPSITNPPVNPPINPGQAAVDCTIPITTFLQTIDHGAPDSIPSWDQLACYTDDLVRLPQPDTFIATTDRPPAAVLPGPYETPPSAWETMQAAEEWDQLWAPYSTVDGGYHVNIPPYLTDFSGTQGPFFPLTAEQWDEKLRALMAYGIYEKRLGKIVTMSYFHSPLLGDEPYRSRLPQADISDSESFLAWWNNHFIPERVKLAEIAELLKAEEYMPWDVEPGIVVRQNGGDWLELLPVEERVALAQEIVDSLLAALRPVFTGKLSIIVYDSYAAVGDEWNALDVSGWDQVNFVFFTQGDLLGTEMYLDRQIAGYMEILNRSTTHGQAIPWVAQEVTVEGDLHRSTLSQLEPPLTFEEIEEDIYATVFDRLANAPVTPMGIGLTVGFIETEAARTLVQQKLAAIKADGFVPTP
jgi:hypothetical protein